MHEVTTSILGAIAVTAVIFYQLMQAANEHYARPYKNIRLESGEVVQCRDVFTYRKACALLTNCKDGRERCVQAYEVLPNG